jgi:hypothetical protein
VFKEDVVSGSEFFAVVSPTGAKAPQAAWTPAPTVPDLSGKVIAELWDYIFRGDVMFEVIRKEIRERYDDVTFVHWSEFGDIHGSTEAEVIAALPEELRRHGVDVTIVGVGA